MPRNIVCNVVCINLSLGMILKYRVHVYAMSEEEVAQINRLKATVIQL